MSLKTDANFKRSLRRVWSERSGPQISILTVASRSFSILTVNTDFSVSILFQQHADDRTKTIVTVLRSTIHIVTVNTDFPITIVILHRKERDEERDPNAVLDRSLRTICWEPEGQVTWST